MLYPELKIASGHDNEAGFVAIETVVATAPRCTPVPRGSVAERALSGKLRRDGSVDVVWSWGILSHSDLDTLITTYLGTWDTDSAEVTIRTLKRDGTYGNYNAVMYLPVADGEDEEGGYEQRTTRKLTNVRIRFANLTAT